MEKTTTEYVNEVIRSIDERIAEAEGILKFLKAQKAAAMEQRDGRKPTLTYYFVKSRSGNEGHYVKHEAVTNKWTCTCQAGRNGRDCWAKKGVITDVDPRTRKPSLGMFMDERFAWHNIGYSDRSWYAAEKSVRGL